MFNPIFSSKEVFQNKENINLTLQIPNLDKRQKLPKLNMELKGMRKFWIYCKISE